MSSIYLQETADKLSVVETLYRFAAGIDLQDRVLFASAFTENAVSDFRPAGTKAGFDYPVLEGRDTIVATLLEALSHVDTTHSVSNPRASINGDKAQLDALVEAQHVLKIDPSRHYLMKNRYDVEMVKQGDIWLIERVTVDNIWRTGELSALFGS
ncbi:nuclear transport factor 2 family protein [Pseudomonas abietaniphila]|uniref:nuclear transport factor 2 family protein n=1 Tax=Pseudomonas abietaniphila TaxID=89065 RepID=UPI0007853A5B|nr:nuclear transport factor 2 family protein [Pseudomonas abietaniphila]